MLYFPKKLADLNEPKQQLASDEGKHPEQQKNP